MRAIGLVLLSIAIVALLLTTLRPSAGRACKGARRRWPAEAGARPFPSKALTTTAASRQRNERLAVGLFIAGAVIVMVLVAVVVSQ